MNYANAKKGIGQIYKAEILLLLATVLAIIGSIVALVGASKESTGGVVAGSVPLLIAGILAIIAFVMNLVGLSHASKDHPDFKTAWIITLVAIAASIVQSVLTVVILLGVFLVLIAQMRKNAKLNLERETQDAMNRVKQQELEQRLELQEKLLEEEKQKTQQDQLITAMASDYHSVYYVNLDEDEAIC